eukprot:5312563-Amphidinium_carterae.1
MMVVVEHWPLKLSYGAAAYVSPQLPLASCPDACLLLGVGADDSADLVQPLQLPDTEVAEQPLALFLGAPAGSTFRFALEAGCRSAAVRHVYFHSFKHTAGFAGSRSFLPTAMLGIDEESNSIQIRVEILGLERLGAECAADVLSSV